MIISLVGQKMNNNKVAIYHFLKLFIIISLVLAALSLVLIFLVDFLSYREVKFALSSETKSITVYNKEEYDELRNSTTDKSKSNHGELSATGSIRIKPGDYYVVPSGDNIDRSAISIQINDNTENIDVNPYFSSSYLSSNFSNQTTVINQIITDRYKNIISNYSIDNGLFLHYGDWYVTSLYNEPTVESGSDTYGIILHKVNDKWQIAATPELVFRYDDHKDIPKDIINSVNRLVNQ